MDRGLKPMTTQVDLAALSREDLINFRRQLLGLLACVELALSQHGLTFSRKGSRW